MRRRAGTNARRAVAEWRLRCGRRAPQPFGKATRLQNATALSKRARRLRMMWYNARSGAQHHNTLRPTEPSSGTPTPRRPARMFARPFSRASAEFEDGTQLIDGMSSWWAAVHGYRVPSSTAPSRTRLKNGARDVRGLTHRFDLGVLVLRCLHAIDATRVHLTMTWVVSFSILSQFIRVETAIRAGGRRAQRAAG